MNIDDIDIEPNLSNINKGICIICNGPKDNITYMTCGQKCHDIFIEFCEKKFGESKRVIDIHTGISHMVPTRDIIEKGLRHDNLKNYPIWKDGEINNA